MTKAEQTGSPWAKTLGFEFGDELVRRWNWYEPHCNQIERLTKENERLQGELNAANAKIAQLMV